MNKLLIACSLLLAASFFGSKPLKAQSAPYVVGVCNISGQLYNIDQYYGIHVRPSGSYMGQLVSAPTPSGWIAVRSDGVQFAVAGCQW